MRRLIVGGALLFLSLGGASPDPTPVATPTPWAEVCCAPVVVPPTAFPTPDLCYQTGGRFGC